MANLTDTQKKIMGSLYERYNLYPEDIFTHKNYKIITRQGIDKILSGSDIKFSFEDREIKYYPYIDRKGDQKIGTFTSLKIVGWKKTEDGVEKVETYGESTPYNTTNEYAVAMAEKRAKARLALMLEGLYQHGFYGEDEADDFKKSNSYKATEIKR